MNTMFEKAAQQFADLMIEKIRTIATNWKKPWFTKSFTNPDFFPQNYSERRYSGGNAFLLMFICEKHNYKTPVFLTFLQAQEAEIKVLKGAKSFPIYYYTFLVKHKITKVRIEFETYKMLPKEKRQNYDVFGIVKFYYVFNLEQTDFSEVRPEQWQKLLAKFAPPKEEETVKPVLYSNTRVDLMLNGNEWVCPIRQDYQNRAYYSTSRDYIQMPQKEQFQTGEEFYSTLLHEMSHSTGHEKRLKREIQNPFGSPKYAKEELIAELSGAFLASLLGITTGIQDNNAAYLKSWLGSLQEDSKYILSVLQDAAKAVEFTCNYLGIGFDSEKPKKPIAIPEAA